MIIVQVTLTSCLALVFALNFVYCKPVVLNTWSFSNATLTGWNALSKANSTAVEAVVAGCAYCESGICASSVGAGGSPDETGETTLDAMIMDGTTMNVGSVGCLRKVQNAIGVAHAVMMYTKHTMLVGDLATKFALEMGFQGVDLHSNASLAEWKNWNSNNCQPNYRQNVSPDAAKSCGPYKPVSRGTTSGSSTGQQQPIKGSSTEWNHDTIGMIAVDSAGNMAAGTSTNGLNHKVPGRVGDSPIVGSGAYAQTGVGAAVATGDGDILMRFVPSFDALQLMAGGMSPSKAALTVIKKIAKYYPVYAGAVLAINANGDIGAACHGFGNFPYCVSTSEGLKVYQIDCLQ